jgi:hypothetical protein
MLRRHAVEAVDIHATADEVHPVTFRGPDFEGWLMPLTSVSLADDEDEDDEPVEAVDIAPTAGEEFKQHMLVATMREEWRAEFDRLDAIMARVDELLKSAPNRGLRNLLETMSRKRLAIRHGKDPDDPESEVGWRVVEEGEFVDPGEVWDTEDEARDAAGRLWAEPLLERLQEALEGCEDSPLAEKVLKELGADVESAASLVAAAIAARQQMQDRNKS